MAKRLGDMTKLAWKLDEKNTGGVFYASRFVVPPGPTPTLVHDIDRKRSTEGAIGRMKIKKPRSNFISFSFFLFSVWRMSN